jgi:ribosomal protein S6
MSNTEELPIVSPAELESKMVEKALTEDPTGTPADKAAAFFQRSVEDLEKLIDNMSHRALKRMILNVATYPFLDREYTVKKDSTEFKASYRFNEMVWHKTIMQLQAEQEKAQKAIDENKTEDLNLPLTKGESTNGSENA